MRITLSRSRPRPRPPRLGTATDNPEVAGGETTWSVLACASITPEAVLWETQSCGSMSWTARP